jgi:hypothetical protein
VELRCGEIGRIIEWQWQSNVGCFDRDGFNAVDKVTDRQRLSSLGVPILNSSHRKVPDGRGKLMARTRKAGVNIGLFCGLICAYLNRHDPHENHGSHSSNLTSQTVKFIKGGHWSFRQYFIERTGEFRRFETREQCDSSTSPLSGDADGERGQSSA